MGINTTAPLKKLHIRNSGLLIDGTSASDGSPYDSRLIVDAQASTAHVLADFRNNNGSVMYVTGARVAIGNTNTVSNVLNVNGGDALINTLTVGLGSGQVATNTALGFQALLGVTTGVQVTAFGYQAGLSNTIGIENTFIGYLAGRTNTSGGANIAVGGIALFANSTGGFNVAVGRGALTANTIGNNNAALGHGALSNNTSGSNNAAFGFLALQNNVTTSGNTGIGRDALRYYANSSNQTAVGFGALQGNGTVALNTGTGNVAVGFQAGLANSSGSNNTFVGESAGLANTSGSNNLFVGYQAGLANLTGSNNVVLGYLSFASNTLGSFNFAAGGMNANTTGNSNSGAGLFSLNSNTTGSNNTAFGRDALRYWTTTSQQTAVGSGALQGNSNTTLNTGTQNIAVGFEAGLANTSGFLNTYLGHQAGRANASGTHNTYVGALTGTANTSNHNVVVGANSFANSITGGANVVIGSISAGSNTTGTNNTVVGYNIFGSNTTGNNNQAFGFNALSSNVTGDGNVAIGRFALRYYNQSEQVAIGDQALQGNSTVALNTGARNTAIGFRAGSANTSGQDNVFVGYYAGLANTSGIYNVAVGSGALAANTTAGYNNAFGYLALTASTSGEFNNAFGQGALQANTTGGSNSAFGHNALAGNTTGGNNVALGILALVSNTTSSNNVAIGRSALRYYNQSAQVAVGYEALTGSSTVALNTGTQNTAVGYQAGLANTSGVRNTFIGYQVGLTNTSGSDNVAVGNQSLTNNQSGLQNIAVGSFALLYNVTGNYNVGIGQDSLRNFESLSTQVAIGYRALRGNDTRAQNTGFSNVAIGREALGISTSGSNNTALGTLAGTVNSTGNQNTFIGAQSGDGNTTGNSNTYLGYLTDGLPTGSYQIAVGDSATPTASNLGAWGGNTNSTRTNLGIGSFTPLARLHVETLASGNLGIYVAGSVSQTGNLLEIDATTNGTSYMVVNGVGSLGILTGSPTQNLHVQGNARITGGIFDSSNQIGLAGSVLSSTGTGLAWTAQSASAAASLSGSGAANQVTFWSGANSLRGISTFVYQNGALGIGTSSPRGALEATNEIYVENIYIGAGNSFTNTIVGLGVSFYSTGAIADLDYTTVLGYRANATSDPLPGIIIGSEAVTNTSYASANAFQKHILIGNNVHSDLNIRFDSSPPGKTIIGHSAYRYIDNSDDRDSANLIIIGEEAYSGTATTYLADENQNVIIGNYASKSANFSLSLIIGHGAGQAFDFSTPASARESNIIIGNSAAQNLTGGNNVLIGAGVANTSSLGIYNNNVALGYYNNIAAADYQIALGPNVNTVRANAGAWGGNTNVTRTDLGIGTFAPLSRLHLETLSSGNMGLLINGSTSQTADLLEVNATTTGANFFTITGIGSVGIYTSAPTQALHVRGNARITGGIFDSNNQIGLANSVLISTGTGISWTSQLSNVLTGSGTINTVAKFSSASTLSNSNIIDTGTLITLGSGVTVSGILTSFGFFGPGTNITNLNASNLASGTVPSVVISGSYSGITSVGNLTQLNVTGITTSNIFVGNGSNITNLNAVNLASGIVPSAVISGSYSGITSVGNLTQLNVTGITSTVNLRISGILYDNSFSSGTQNQILSSTGTAISWTTINSVGIITGTGTLNTIPKFGGPASLTTSNITDNGLAVTVNSRLNVVGVGSFRNDLVVNNITVGVGSANVNTNVAIGVNALANNPSGSGTVVAIGDRAVQNASGVFFGVVAIGSQALQNNQASRNVAIGTQALRSTTTGASNMAIGHLAMDLNQTGSANVAIGRGALQANVSSSSNTVIGDSAMNLATSDENVAIGAQAMNSLTSGRANQAFGASAMRYITTVSNLTAVGYGALAGSATTTLNTGTQNTVVGYQAGTANTSGSNNIFVGFQAGLANTSGSQNVFLGRTSGNTMLTGSNNTFLGDATNGNIAASYQIAVGQAVVPTASNLGAWGGNTNATRTDLGVGTFSPLARIHVETLNAGNAGLYVAGAASQTANLLEVDLTINGTTALVVTGVGSVGVNTATAAYPLHVQGAARFTNVGIGVAPQTSSILDVAGNINLSPGSAYRWGNGDSQISNTSGQYNIIFTTFNGTAAQENMRIVSRGYIGVGTTIPESRLHVRSGFTTGTVLQVTGLTGQTADLFRIESTLQGTRFVTVGAAGSVGIGTTTPTQPLHVQGNARFGSSIFDNNNLPGAPIGIVSQVLTSTGVGVTWAPIKRSLITTLVTAFTPSGVGIDTAVFIVPQDPINGTSSVTFNFRRVNVRVETPSAGITTINVAKSISTGAFIGTSILATNINLAGASIYEANSTTFATGFTTAASNDKLSVNFIGLSTFHQNFTVEIIMQEA